MKNAPINDPEGQDEIYRELKSWSKEQGILHPIEEVDGYPVPGRTEEEIRIMARKNMEEQRKIDAEDGIVYDEEETEIQNIGDTDTPVSHESGA